MTEKNNFGTLGFVLYVEKKEAENLDYEQHVETRVKNYNFEHRKISSSDEMNATLKQSNRSFVNNLEGSKYQQLCNYFYWIV